MVHENPRPVAYPIGPLGGLYDVATRAGDDSAPRPAVTFSEAQITLRIRFRVHRSFALLALVMKRNTPPLLHVSDESTAQQGISRDPGDDHIAD